MTFNLKLICINLGIIPTSKNISKTTFKKLKALIEVFCTKIKTVYWHNECTAYK